MTKEKEEPTLIRGVPWALWLSSGLVIALLLFSTVMLMVTMYSGLFCAKPINSSSEFQPLVRNRPTTNESPETATDDEEIKKKISEIFNRKGYSNPDPDPEDQIEDAGSQIETRIDHPRRRRTRRPLQKIGKDFDPSQSYVIKHANGTITYVFPENVLSDKNKGDLVTKDIEDRKKIDKNEVEHRKPTPVKETPIQDKSCTPEYPICNNVENYPHDKINDIVAKYKQQFAGVFGEDVVVPEGDSLVPRFDTSDDTPLCYSIEKLIHPQVGFTKDDKKYQIVNTREYKQGVRVELCGDTGGTCKDLDGLLGSRTTECKQLYHYRTLLALDPQTGEPYKESFKLPSCCKCVIKPLKINSDGK